MSRSRKKAIIKDKRRIQYNRIQRRSERMATKLFESLIDKDNDYIPTLYPKGDWSICDWVHNIEYRGWCEKDKNGVYCRKIHSQDKMNKYRRK